MFDLYDCAAFITNKTSKMLSERLEARMAVYHVTRTQWLAMYFINKTPDMTQNELAESLGTKGSTVVSLLDRMERDGLIIRTTVAEDRRVRHLMLTPKGRKLTEKLTSVAEQFKEDAIKDLSEEELDTFKFVLATMIKNTD